MSLTSLFTTDNEIKKKLLELFPKPIWKISKEMKAPPLTNHYALIGTAFDYLLRFQIRYLNKNKLINSEKWVAEEAVNKLINHLDSLALLTTHVGAGMKGEKHFERWNLKNNVLSKLAESKELCFHFYQNGIISRKLFECALFLAKMDNYFRSGIIDPSLFDHSKDDIKDLENLFSILDNNLFRVNSHCYLNPTFGEGSKLVGGADADIVLDNFLIDIKTTKNPILERDHFNQLIGYYTIASIGGVAGNHNFNPIEKVGIYFARHGVLWTEKIDAIAPNENFVDFKYWLLNHLRK